MMPRMLFFAIFIAFCGTALAQAEPDDVDSSDVDGLQFIISQQKVLKADLDDGGIEGLSARQNKIVGKAQVEVFAVTEGKTRMDDLSMNEKIRLENALERINAEIENTRAAGNEQNVCWRERVSGTTVKKTRCGTQAEMREAREGARDFMEKAKICVPPGCGG
jgi:hypothetical protein